MREKQTKDKRNASQCAFNTLLAPYINTIPRTLRDQMMSPTAWASDQEDPLPKLLVGHIKTYLVIVSTNCIASS